MPVTCVSCGREYKNLKTYLRHSCAKRAGEVIEQAFDDGDVTEIAEAEGPDEFWAEIEKRSDDA